MEKNTELVLEAYGKMYGKQIINETHDPIKLRTLASNIDEYYDNMSFNLAKIKLALDDYSKENGGIEPFEFSDFYKTINELDKLFNNEQIDSLRTLVRKLDASYVEWTETMKQSKED